MNGNECKSFKWNFGDGPKPEITETATIKHVFKEQGTYLVECIVTDNIGTKKPNTLKFNQFLMNQQ